MNNLILNLTILACLFSLYACSTASNSQLFLPAKTKHDKATIYIYRPTAMANALYSPELHVNGEIKLNLKVSTNNLLTLMPGETTFEISPDKKYSGKTSLTLSLSSNKLYYLRVDTSLKIKNSLSYETYQRSFNLTLVDKEQAGKEISQCCTKNIKKNENRISDKTMGTATNTTTNETKEIKPETSDGFSVDKTQNPFSH